LLLTLWFPRFLQKPVCVNLTLKNNVKNIAFSS
jgi:hypothetical protein